MSYLKVDTGALMHDVQSVEDKIGIIDSKFVSMYNDVNALNGMWKGMANQKFTESFSNDYQAIKEFMEELKKYAARLEDDRNAYHSCENNVIGMVENI